MYQKRKRNFLFFLAMLTLFTFVSCSDEQNQEQLQYGSLSIETANLRADTFAPTDAEVDITHYTVTGINPKSESVTLKTTTDKTMPITIDNLLVGSWSITINGLNAAGTIVQTATQTVTIEATKTTDSTFELQPASGTGSCDITIKWPESLFAVDSIVITTDSALTESEPAIPTTGLSLTVSDVTESEGMKTLTQSISNIPAGSYQVTLQLLDATDVLVGKLTDVMNIYNDMTSTGTFEFPLSYFTVVAPTIEPVAGSSIKDTQTITLSTETDDASIYYTTDGSEPTNESTLYAAPFTLSADSTVQAIAISNDIVTSSVSSADFTILTAAATPTASPEANTYDAQQSVTLSTTSTDAHIYYTTDGSDPTAESTLYNEAIVVSKNTTVKAIALGDNWSDSPLATFAYKIKTAVPSFGTAEGTYNTTQSITLTAADGATIYYTTDGSDPTAKSTLYSEEIAVSETTTMKAIAMQDNMESSSVVSATYTIAGTGTFSVTEDTKYDVTITPPTDWTENPVVIVNAYATLSAEVSPTPADDKTLTYAWYVDGEEQASTTSELVIGDKSRANPFIETPVGLHQILVTVSDGGDKNYSGSYLFASSQSGLIGNVQAIKVTDLRAFYVVTDYTNKTGNIYVSWVPNAPDSDVASTSVSYTVSNGASQTGTILNDSCTIPNILAENKIYTITVTTIDTATNSNEVSVTVNPFLESLVLVPSGTVSTVPADEPTDSWNQGPFASAATTPVDISSFSLGSCEVNYALWYKIYSWATTESESLYTFAKSGREGDTGVDGAAPHYNRRPVTNISWRDCLVWCNAYSEYCKIAPVYYTDDTNETVLRDSTVSIENNCKAKSNNNGMRLPTETEWEYAARGGDPTDETNWNYMYSGSDTANDVAWNSDNSSWHVCPSALKNANVLGLYDMSGNVWEKCYNKYKETTSSRAKRGGSFDLDANHSKVISRNSDYPDYGNKNLGFRICANI